MAHWRLSKMNSENNGVSRWFLILCFLKFQVELRLYCRREYPLLLTYIPTWWRAALTIVLRLGEKWLTEGGKASFRDCPFVVSLCERYWVQMGTNTQIRRFVNMVVCWFGPVWVRPNQKTQTFLNQLTFLHLTNFCVYFPSPTACPPIASLPCSTIAI